MDIVILGTGCARCRQTADTVRQAVEQSGVDATIRKVEDPREIMKYRVMMTPAVAVDGTVRIAGRVPTVQEVRTLLETGGGERA
jgi:small redox-active disulfide protein 2